jgi:hypothetical protein
MMETKKASAGTAEREPHQAGRAWTAMADAPCATSASAR